MKKLKEFKSEQKYITEVGPIGALMMGVMGLWGGYQAFKRTKEKIKGYRESQAEKKSNKEYGVEIEIKKIDPDTGEEYTEIETLEGSDANLDSDGVYKAQKEAQKKYDTLQKSKDKKAAREKMRDALGMVPDEPMTKAKERKGIELLKKQMEPDEPEEPSEPSDDSDTSDTTSDIPVDKKDDPEQELRRKGDAGEIEDEGEANEYFKLVGKAPSGWNNQGDKDNPKLVQSKKQGTQGKVTGKDTSAADKLLRRNSRLLKFGEFISEGVMDDLKKSAKTKKDTEIKLDDGTKIPLDQMTAEILVKYIEGLKSSEQKRIVNQIQRTERAFMKVLGKAHGE